MASVILPGKLTCKSDTVTLLLPLQRESKFGREIEGSIEKKKMFKAVQV